MENVTEDRGQKPAVFIALLRTREEFLEIVHHRGEADAVIAYMAERLGADLFLVVLDQVLPRMAHHVGHTEKHHPDGAPFDQVEEFAMIIAHRDRAAADQRDGRIRRERDRTLVHHRDFGRHLTPRTPAITQGLEGRMS